MDERIIGGTGTRPDWDECWIDTARIVGQRSKCDRDKVGAVIVAPGNGQGFVASYNGPPAGREAEGSCLNWCARARPGNTDFSPDYGDCPSCHAEQNAITRADFSKIKDGAIYVTSSVCFTCAKLVANSGIKRVVMMVDESSQKHRTPMKSIDFLLSCGLEVEVWQTGYGVPRKRMRYESKSDQNGQTVTITTEIGTFGSQLGW